MTFHIPILPVPEDAPDNTYNYSPQHPSGHRKPYNKVTPESTSFATRNGEGKCSLIRHERPSTSTRNKCKSPPSRRRRIAIGMQQRRAGLVRRTGIGSRTGNRPHLAQERRGGEIRRAITWPSAQRKISFISCGPGRPKCACITVTT